MQRWSPGKTIVIQEVWRDQLWAARPVTVVRDDGEQLIAWCPKGTVRKVPATPLTRPSPTSRPHWFADLLSRCDWILTDSTWDISTLWLLREGDWHSVWVSFLDDGVHLGYYINLQEPFRRSTGAIRTMDLMLDVVIDRAGSWRWKDEEDLEILMAQELIDPVLAQRVREEALSVIKSFELGKAPFDGTWSTWRPKASWSTPQLPPGWNDLSD